MPSLLLSIPLLHGAALAGTVLHGHDAGDRFGSSVGNAGDVNGDGYGDVIVGAPAADLGTGRAMLYLGGPSGPSLAPALILYGDPAFGGPNGSEFGSDVSSAGDVNGDGYADVAIAAGGPGLVYVYLGSPLGLSASPAAVLGGYGFFGTRSAAAGDVNGDGYGDLVVGASGAGHYEVSGRAFVYLGSSTGVEPSPVATWTGGNDFYGGSDDYLIGDDVAGAGDVDGDGYDDVLVTADGPGEVWLFAGSPAGPGAVPAVVWTDPTGSAGGYRVTGGADLNGDGSDDVVVAWGGTIAAYLGSPAGIALNPSDVVRLQGANSLSMAGDLDADGFADVVVGWSTFHNFQGRVDVLFGSARGLIAGSSSIRATNADSLGVSVSTAGDLDGDGFGDLAVGGPDAGAGQVLISLGHPRLSVAAAAASVGGGASVDVVDARPGDRVSVGQTTQPKPGFHGAVLLGRDVADAAGNASVVGAVPPGTVAGTVLRFQAVDARTDAGWTSAETSDIAAAVATP